MNARLMPAIVESMFPVVAATPPAVMLSAAKGPRFIHVRHGYEEYNHESKADLIELLPVGGYTFAYEVLSDISLIRIAYAKCSLNDIFCLRTGRIKAAGRLAGYKKYMERLEMRRKAFHSAGNLFEVDYYKELDIHKNDRPNEIVVRWIKHMFKRRYDLEYLTFGAKRRLVLLPKVKIGV